MPTFSETRFNGGYLVMKALLPQEDAIRMTLDALQLQYPKTWALVKDFLPPEDCWETMRMATKVLEPVHEFIINMQRRGATLSDFVIQIRRMYEGLDQRASTNRALRQQMINELMLYFKSDDIRISPSVSIHDLLRAGPSHKDAHQRLHT